GGRTASPGERVERSQLPDAAPIRVSTLSNRTPFALARLTVNPAIAPRLSRENLTRPTTSPVNTSFENGASVTSVPHVPLRIKAESRASTVNVAPASSSLRSLPAYD